MLMLTIKRYIHVSESVPSVDKSLSVNKDKLKRLGLIERPMSLLFILVIYKEVNSCLDGANSHVTSNA